MQGTSLVHDPKVDPAGFDWREHFPDVFQRKESGFDCVIGNPLVAPHGRVGMLVPSGIASDLTTKDFFAAVAESKHPIRWYDFKNQRVFFPDVHASFKFCILNFGLDSSQITSEGNQHS